MSTVVGPLGVRRLVRPGPELWGLLDQGLVSSVNFISIILLARTLAPADFGYFVLAFTILQSAGTLQAALITRPHNVLGALRRGSAYADYSTTAAATQGAFTATLALIAAGAAGIAYAAGFSHAVLFLALPPALITWQLQELGRRMLYTEDRLGGALANDVVGYGGQAATLVVLWRIHELTAARALLTLAAWFAIGGVIVAYQLRHTLSGKLDAASLAANWHFGKWLGVAEVGQWFSTQFYIYLGGAIAGPITSGVLKAGQTLLGPMSVFLTFVTSYLPIVYARELEATGSIRAKTRRAFMVILPVVVPYCVAVAVFAKPLLGFVYGHDYRHYTDVVELFCLYYVLLAFSTVAIAALSARALTRDVFVGQASGAALSLAIGWLLLQRHGAVGGVTGMLVSWALAMTLFLRALRQPRAAAGTHIGRTVTTADDG